MRATREAGGREKKRQKRTGVVCAKWPKVDEADEGEGSRVRKMRFCFAEWRWRAPRHTQSDVPWPGEVQSW